MRGKCGKRYKKKGSRTARLVKAKFAMELEDFLRQEREHKFKTDAEIAAMIGVGHEAIRRSRQKFGIKFRLAGMRNKSRDDQICKLRSTGKYTLQALADRYGLTNERVRQILLGNDAANRRLIAR